MKLLQETKWQVAAFCLLHLFIFAALFSTDVYSPRYSAAGLYWDYATRVMEGNVVYRDFAMEYPPLSLLVFVLPRLFTDNLGAYTAAFTVQMLVFDIAAIILIAALARRLGQKAWLALAAYTAFLLSLGPIAADRYDLVPGVLSLAAIYAFISGREKTAWGIAAAGTLMKLFPAVLIPLFLIDALKRRNYRGLAANIFVFTVVALALTAPFLLLAPEGFISSFTYHAARGLHVESLYASLLLAAHFLGFSPFVEAFAFGSWNVISAPAPLLASVSTAVFAVVIALVYFLFARNPPADRTARDMGLVNFGLIGILAFIVSSKVLSPQFLLWVLPLVPLVSGNARLAWPVFGAVALTTYYVFPLTYLELIPTPHLGTGLVLIARNGLLLLLFVILLRASARRPPPCTRPIFRASVDCPVQ